MVRLPAEPEGVVVPPLPGAGRLLKSTREWWETVWTSPMASVYLPADVPALARLARLVDAEARGDVNGVGLSEIRRLEDAFGLSPMARRRLQWEIDQARGGAAGVVPVRAVSVAQRERLTRRRVLAVDLSDA